MIYLELLKPQGVDFPQYFSAAKTLLSGLNPYDKLLGFSGPFNYPPTSFVFLYWLGFFPLNLSSVLWNIFSFLAYLVSILLLLKIRGGFSKTKYLISVFLLTIPFFPEKFNLGNGQINNYILFFVVLSFYLENRRKLVSSFLLSLATLIKLIPGIYFLHYVLTLNKKYLITSALTALIIFAMSFVLVPFNFQIKYFSDVFFQAFSSGGKDVYYVQSVAGFFARSFHGQALSQYVSWIFSFIVLVITIIKYRKLQRIEQFSALTCLYLMLNPLAWQHHFVFAVIPLILLSNSRELLANKSEFGKNKWGILFLSYLLIAWNFKNPNTFPFEIRFLLSNQFLGVFLLWTLAVFRNRSKEVIGFVWIFGILIGYIFIVLCKNGICF